MTHDIRYVGKIHEMRLCEASRVHLKPGLLYLFTIDPECIACREAAVASGGSSDAALASVPQGRPVMPSGRNGV